MLNLLFLSEKDVKEKESIVQNVYHIAMSDELKGVMNNMGSFAQVLITEAKREARDETSREERRGFATRLIMGGHLSLSQIAACSLLDQDTVEELADEMGVTLPPDPDTP